MRDKLSKKRIKVDYQLIIRVLDLDLKFLEYQWKKQSKISINRQALAFLRFNKVDYETVWNECLEKGIHSYEDWIEDYKKICSFNIWDND